MRLSQCQGSAAAGERTAGDHHPRHTCRFGPRQHRLAVGCKGVVGQIGADVDQIHHVGAARFRARCSRAKWTATPTGTRPPKTYKGSTSQTVQGKGGGWRCR